jgi:methyl-accepting chemotaxis protein
MGNSTNKGMRFMISTLAILFLLVLGCIIYMNISDQRSHIKAEVLKSANMVADSAYNGMIYPMSVGDSDTIWLQMAHVKSQMKGIEVLVFDFNKHVTYASEKDKAGKDLTKLIRSADLEVALDQMVKDGKAHQVGYEEVMEGKHSLTVLRPILNESRCYHCHGSSRSVLGGLMTRQNTEKMYKSLGTLRNKNIIIGFSGCLVTILVLLLMISRLVIKPVKKVALVLYNVVAQVGSSSGQLSSASRSLAEGAAEQASSLEETSSSLEEMSSMTKQNADHAQQADHLSKGSLGDLKDANASMKSLIESMEDISTASGNVAKIIKTIDEIAFQTNLLALNAAVEAARAGEVGAGFAVVADEVRNLALRSAEASGNTHELIKDITLKIDRGSGLVSETDDRYRKVALSVQKVTELVGEISAASNQQAQGIEQVNKAVAEMDKVTQQNAANAEESDSAAEEMNAQAEQMKGVVGELMALVGGNDNRVSSLHTVGVGSKGRDRSTGADSGGHEALAQRSKV